jgi:hypothetical protein
MMIITINPTHYKATLPYAAVTNRVVVVTYVGGESPVLQQGKFSLHENPDVL